MVDAHEIPVGPPSGSTTARALQVGVEAVGFLVIVTPPFWSTATHRAVDGHETLARAPSCPSIATGELQTGLAAVGSVEITTSPPPSTATHNAVDGHEIPSKPPPLLSISAALHVGVEPSDSW